MKNEFQIMLHAIQFYTRIPLGNRVQYLPERQTQSIRYFPLIGLLLGALSAGVFIGLDMFFNPLSALILSVIISILFTGALHEDGFADCCDGFGGGSTKERILRIMKDSSIGAYGALGLILLFALKFSMMYESITDHFNDSLYVIFLLTTAFSMSRMAAATLLFWMDYARVDDQSKSAEIAKRMSIGNFLFIVISGSASLLVYCYLTHNYLYLITLPVVATVTLICGRYFNKRINGYTGDCLGATQQVVELSIYALFAFS